MHSAWPESQGKRPHSERLESDAKRPRVTLKKASQTHQDPPPRPPRPADQDPPPRQRSSTQNGSKALISRKSHTSGTAVDKPVTLRESSASNVEPVTLRESHKSEVGKQVTLRESVQADDAPAVFEVSGKIFKVSTELVCARPDTLLAQLVESNPKNCKQPIFVDSDASRFALILDWYRYDEMHVPPSMSIETLLLDAVYFRLPQEICINGVLRSTEGSAGHQVARSLVSTVVAQWRGFPAYFEAMLEKIRRHYKGVATNSATGTAEDEAYDFLPFRMPIYDEEGAWTDPQNVGSAARARVLALKLEGRGYLCSFSDTELTVALPLKLQGELAVQAPLDEEELDELPVDGSG